MPVTDSDVRAHLAECWSRSQPKEAALDYVLNGAWRNAKQGARAGVGNGGIRSADTTRDGPGDRRGEAAEDRFSAANDNAIMRIAREIRHAVNGWRHGAAVDVLAAERAEVLAAWDELRARTREEDDAVALSPVFHETLDRHGALIKQAASFRARPQTFERLLAERASIGERDLEELREVDARAGKYLRSVKAKTSHVARHDAYRKEAGVVEEIATGIAAPATESALEEQTPSRHADAVAPGPEQDATTDLRTLYKELQREWNHLVTRAEEPDLHLPLIDGYDGLIRRVRPLAANPDLSACARNVLSRLQHVAVRRLTPRR